MNYEPELEINRRRYKLLTKAFWPFLISYSIVLFIGLIPDLKFFILIACISGYVYIKNLSELLFAANRSCFGHIVQVPKSGLIALIPIWGVIYTYSRIKYIATLNTWDTVGTTTASSENSLWGKTLINRITAGALFLAILPMPSEYYWALRIAICGISIYYFFDKKEGYKDLAKVGFVLMAIVFNPILPVYLSKISWVMIDIASGVLFLWLNSWKSRRWAK